MTPNPTVVMMGFNGMHSSGGYLKSVETKCPFDSSSGKIWTTKYNWKKKITTGKDASSSPKMIEESPTSRKKNPETKQRIC
jgi:hypothetical protein